MAMSQQPTPPVNKYTGSYTEDVDGDGIRMNAFGHEDADVAFDPLSANRRFPGTADLEVLGTLVFAGPTRESIDVMVPDCLLPPASGTVRIDLRHHVSLSLGPAVDMSNWVPETQLEKALCPTSLAKTLGLQRRDYWDELIFRPAPPAATLQNGSLFRTGKSQRIQIPRRWDDYPSHQS